MRRKKIIVGRGGGRGIGKGQERKSGRVEGFIDGVLLEKFIFMLTLHGLESFLSAISTISAEPTIRLE